MKPDRIGPYIIEKKIGSGGMGTVYLGRHGETDQLAAVKVLPASFSQEEGAVERFSREIEALKKLTNPHVVKLYESGLDEGTYFYAMEYVDGETLSSRLIREKRIGWRETIDIAVQICSALKAAHDAGFVHRDLKPSNLIFASDGSIRLTDFGVAQVFAAGRLTMTGGIIGTAEYMSPEQAQGKRVTKKSDLYSLGAVMYVMLTGRPPFSGKTTLDIVQKHKYAQFDRPGLMVPEMPHWLDEVICQLMEKDPEKRIPDAYVLSRRLQEVVKKVDFSTQEQTMAADGYDGTAPTVADNGNIEEPGMATLMRDLVKAEVENAQRPSYLSRFFDNIWVLLGIMLLLIAGGVFWFGGEDLSPAELFAEGVALMKQPEGPNWIIAREEYFQPLLKSDADHWKKEIEPHLQRIQRYELKHDLENQTRKLLRRSNTPQGEVERFLRLANYYHDMGNVSDAERILSALGAMIEDDPNNRELYKLTLELLQEWRTERKNDPERYAILRAAMDRADQLAAQGKLPEARKIWESVIELYGNDPEADDLMDRARDELLRTKTKKEQ